MSVQNDTISPLIIIFWQLFQKKIGNFWLQWVKFYLSQTSSFWFTFTLTCMGRTEYQTPAEGNENLYAILYNLLKCSTVPWCCLMLTCSSVRPNSNLTKLSWVLPRLQQKKKKHRICMAACGGQLKVIYVPHFPSRDNIWAKSSRN